MDYIAKLTDEELKTACGFIPIKYFRESFKNNTQKFYKLYTGCRPEKVTPETVKYLAVKYRNNLFLSDLINSGIQILLNSIQESVSLCSELRKSPQQILFQVLTGSCFKSHIAIYLKLSDKFYPEECAALLESALLELDAKKDAVSESGHGQTTEKIKALQEAVAAAEKALEEAQEANAQKLKELGESYDDLHKKFQSAQASIEEKNRELEKLRSVIDHADVPAQDATDGNEFPYMSLCRVGGPNGNHLELFRLADIIDGTIQKQWEDDSPPLNILFTQDCPKPMDTIGVWKWCTRVNPRSGKDGYVDSRFERQQSPAEIVIIPNCGTVDELKEQLLRGVQGVYKGEKILFSFFANRKYTGLLCRANHLAFIPGGMTTIKPKLVHLPLYEFSEEDIVRLGQLKFYYRVHLGTPKMMLAIRDPLEIIKQTVIERAPISKLKLWGTIRNAQEFSRFLRELPTSDFYNEVAETCACSIDEAEAYTGEFIRRAETYLRQEDLETGILLSAVENSPSLMEKCQSLIEKQWRASHSAQLASAEEALSKARAAVEKEKQTYHQLQDRQKQTQERLEKITAEITRKGSLAEEVEKKVAQRIETARMNAAEFITDLAFSQPGVLAQAAPERPDIPCAFQTGTILDAETLMRHKTWKDFTYTLQEELEEAGVAPQYSPGLAAYLYSAYLHRTPLLLAGPNGRDIADAFSAAMFGRTASSLHCESVFSQEALQQCLEDEGTVVTLDPLSAGWVGHIPTLTAMKGKFLLAVHPFAEDLLIEPRGLYSYMLPLLTELVVDRSAERNFAGGCFDDSFSHFSSGAEQERPSFLKHLPMSLLVQNRLRKIYSDLHGILENGQVDSFVLYGVFPYVYASGSAESYWPKLQSDLAVSKGIQGLLQAFLGEYP